MEDKPPLSLSATYQKLWDTSTHGFAQGQFAIDPWVNSAQDRRRGITLLARPCLPICEKLAGFQTALSNATDGLYCYPPSDLHITVMSIISCVDGFTLGDINPADYVSILDGIVAAHRRFSITFDGVTASPACLMAQGYPEDGTLQALRDSIRKAYRHSGLRQSIDQRYVIKTAHCSVARFGGRVTHPRGLLSVLRQYRAQPFGTCLVDKLALVYHDWYQKKGTVEELAVWPLG